MKPSPFTPLRIIVHLYAWSAALRVLFLAVTGGLGANPIQYLEQLTGRHALTLLILSLFCSPLNKIFKWAEPLKFRRTLGLYAFFHAVVHMIIFVDVDYGLAWSLILKTVAQKPYILIGVTAFLLLIPLALTSFDVWKIRLGKKWKRLHQLVYFIAPLVIAHYLMSKKGNILQFQGDIIKPMIYGLILAILLLIRIPVIRRKLASFPARSLFARRGQDSPRE